MYRYLFVPFSILLGMGLGAFTTVLYYENSSSDLTVSSEAKPENVVESTMKKAQLDSTGVEATNVVLPKVPPLSAAALARIKEIEALYPAREQVPAADADNSVAESVEFANDNYEPAPAEPQILSEQDRVQAQLALDRSQPQEIGEFIDADYPFKAEDAGNPYQTEVERLSPSQNESVELIDDAPNP